MTRPVKFALITSSVLILVLLMLTATGIFIVRSDWLREEVMRRVVAEAETSTGGRVEIGAFGFDWSTLTARIDRLTIHGTEPPGQAPLLFVNRIVIGLKIVSLMKREFDIARVEADAPLAHLIVQSDGTTNIPRPKLTGPRKPGGQTILSLRVGRFDLTNGAILAESPGHKPAVQPWSARGENLVMQVSYNPGGNGASPRYDADVHLAPLHVSWDGFGPVDFRVQATAALEGDRLTVSQATLKTDASAVDLTNVTVRGFSSPVATAQYKAVIWLAEADRVFRLKNFAHAGALHVDGTARFASLRDYEIDGDLSGSGIQYGPVGDLKVTAKISTNPQRTLIDRLSVKALNGEITGAATVNSKDDVRFSGQLDSFDARDLIALAGLPALPYDGILSGPVHATGRLSEENLHDLDAEGTLAVAPAAGSPPLHGQITAHYNGVDETVQMEPSWLVLPGTRIDVSGEIGRRLAVRLQSSDVKELEPGLQSLKLPAVPLKGSAAFDGSVSGPLGNPRIAGHMTVRNTVWRNQPIDSLDTDFTATETGITMSNASFASGILRIRTRGAPGLRVGLTRWNLTDASPATADVQIDNADITEIAALAGQRNLPITGTLGANAQISGTIGDPHATANLTLTKGKIFGEPYGTVSGRTQYMRGGPQTIALSLAAGTKRMTGTAQFDHAPSTTALAGKLTFDFASNTMPLNQITLVHGREPDLLGNAQIKASGAVDVRPGSLGKRPAVELLDLNGGVSATGLSIAGRNLGDVSLTAATQNSVLNICLDSNAVQAAIHGEGSMRLAGDYPVDAKVTFSGLEPAPVASALGAPAGSLNFTGSAAGQLSVNGPARAPDTMTAVLDITQIELRPLPGAPRLDKMPNLALKNNGPIRLALGKSVFRVQNAHMTGPNTDIDVDGSIALRGQSPLNLQMQGRINLVLLQDFSSGLTSSGQLAVDAALRGSLTNPDFSGRAEVKNADLHYVDFSNGLTNTNGVILFNGTRANIQTLTAETGGGKVDVTGFATVTGNLPAFRLEGRAHEVRLRYPEGVSSVSDADLTLAGTSQRSEVSGNISIHRIVLNPKSDAAEMLATLAEPLRTPSTTGVVSNMNLDIQIDTAPDIALESNVAQSIQADASLKLRGTVTNPALLGRVNVTQGEISFFGNKYTISQGTVTFANPAKIEPVLNIALETKARGIDITLMITGPVTKLNVSPRSDPPLQFSDIVALLATGRTPTDSTLAGRDTGMSQNLQQLGASALIGQAIQNPGGAGLQRFFGVSRLKIDPQLTGVTGSPEARLTMEQQVTPELLFTYISDVSSTSTQLIQAEWAFNRRWSAILTREENGYVDMVFAFKKRFK